MSDNQEKLNQQLFNVIKNENYSEAKLKKVKYLIRLGADVFYVKDGVSLLAVARERKEAEIENILIEKMKDEFGEFMKSPNSDKLLKVLGQIKNNKPVVDDADKVLLGKKLMKALEAGDEERALELVREGADANAKVDGSTVLIEASDRGYVEVVKELIDNGADVNARGAIDATALIRAVSAGNLEVVQCLLQNGADIDVKDFDGETALMAAAEVGDLDIVKCLLDNGANVNVENADGYTAIDIASDWGNHGCAKLLAEHRNKLKVQRKNKGLKLVGRKFVGITK